ncbi:MAG: A24 family peptidase [Thermoleophilia bacterium]|nr:A24 family peptidase [Thermoleophilia bacterium]
MPEVPREVIWLVTVVLIEAAVIDGKQLRVPNWLTVHFVAGGLAYWAWAAQWAGFAWALQGAAVGLALLLPLYAIGGMGAGDVKLLAGVGAWVGTALTVQAFVATAIVGGLMAAAMVVRSGHLARHVAMFQVIGNEILTVRSPARLSEIAAARKPTMLLLPYGIPMAVGTIAWFAWSGLLF